MSHQTGNGKISKPIGGLHCQVQKAENCQPILSWSVPLISSSWWCVRLCLHHFYPGAVWISFSSPFGLGITKAELKWQDFLYSNIASRWLSPPHFVQLRAVMHTPKLFHSSLCPYFWLRHCNWELDRVLFLHCCWRFLSWCWHCNKVTVPFGVRLQKTALAFASQNILLVYFQW